MPDDITGVFDDIDPMQFIFPDTAVVQETVEPADFEYFVGLHRLILKTQYAAAAGNNPNPVIFLEGGTTLRGYIARDDENMTQFAGRLQSEASAMHAARLFFHRRTLVAANHVGHEAGARIASAPDILARTTDRKDLHDGIFWYAEEVTSDGGRQRLSGIYEISGDRLVDSQMLSQQPVDMLKDVLG